MLTLAMAPVVFGPPGVVAGAVAAVISFYLAARLATSKPRARPLVNPTATLRGPSLKYHDSPAFSPPPGHSTNDCHLMAV